MQKHAEFLLGLIERQPYLTLDELAMRKHKIPGSRTAVWRFFQRHKRLTFKKSLRAAEQQRTDVARGPRGERLIGRVSQGHWKTITFVAALWRNGMRAPYTLDGTMNGAKFLSYVKQCLARPPDARI